MQFLNLTLDIKTIVDICIMALYFFGVFLIAKKYKANFFLLSTLVVCVMTFAGKIFDLPLVLKTCKIYFEFSGIILLILYAGEIKRDVAIRTKSTKMGKLTISSYQGTREEIKDVIDSIIKSCQNMSKQNIGALIVVVPTSIPVQIVQSGTVLDAQVSSQILESVFFPNSPLHDGALLISGSRAFAGGCLLPLSQDLKLPKELGTRHRAGLGVTERTDVLSIIVSEETGIISIARYGKLIRFADAGSLTIALEHAYGIVKTDGGLFSGQ